MFTHTHTERERERERLDPMFAIARFPFLLPSLPDPTRRFLYLELAEASDQTSVDT
jgi:hypothetical protein